MLTVTAFIKCEILGHMVILWLVLSRFLTEDGSELLALSKSELHIFVSTDL